MNDERILEIMRQELCVKFIALIRLGKQKDFKAYDRLEDEINAIAMLLYGAKLINRDTFHRIGHLRFLVAMKYMY